MTTPGHHYARSREPVTELLADVDDAEAATPVQACPGWQVRDVVAHLLGTVDDALYQKERYGASFGYALPIANGSFALMPNGSTVSATVPIGFCQRIVWFLRSTAVSWP